VEDERLIAALVESFGRWSRCGRKKKPVCSGERKVHNGSRWSVGGFLWWSWWLKAELEEETAAAGGPIEKKKTLMAMQVGCCRCGGRRRSEWWRGISEVERVVVKPVISVVVAAFGCWEGGEREKDREKVAETRKRLIFGLLRT